MEKKRMRNLALVLALATLALAPVACSSGDDEEGAAAGGGSADVGAVEREAAGGETTAAAPIAAPAPVESSLPTVGPQVVQTASVSLTVGRDDFESTIDRARSIALGLGGFVVSSSASQEGETRMVSGTLVVRVPERSYAEVMSRLTALGRVEGQEETGQDVSQELVDLGARARHLEAVERQLLELLDRAHTVSAALAVQSQLNQVQLDLEQTRGRLLYLRDQVTYATISLDIRERQAAPAADDDGWGIVAAWSSAARGFVTVVGWLLVAAATIAPLVLLLALGFVGARLAYRRGLFRLGRGGERPGP
jgi:hypothetical protein